MSSPSLVFRRELTSSQKHILAESQLRRSGSWLLETGVGYFFARSLSLLFKCPVGRRTSGSFSHASRHCVSFELANRLRLWISSVTQMTPWTSHPLPAATLRSSASPVSRIEFW